VTVDPDVVGAVQGEVDRLTRKGVTRVILISHLQNVQEDLALIPELRGVDVAVAGGGDELLANEGDLLVPGDVRNPELTYPLSATDADGRSVPVVTTAGDYKYVGRLVTGFDRCGNVVQVNDPEDEVVSGPVRVSGNPADADYTKANPFVQRRVVAPVEEAVAALAADVVGTSAVALEGRRTPGIRDQETNLGNLMADALLLQGQQLAGQFAVDPPNVAIQNSGGIRNNSLIPAGPISALDTFSIAAFANFLSVVPNVPAAQFKEILENAVSAMPAGGDGRFPQIAGFRFTYDASGVAQVTENDGTVTTPGTKVQEVVLDDGTVIVQGGQVVAGAPDVDIATNDFSARGGDQYPFRGLPFTTLGVTYQQALRNYIEDATWGLGGTITAADYPEGGEGRITRVN
jgi:5'-nucleotidase